MESQNTPELPARYGARRREALSVIGEVNR
jgi:hypothetical protein